MATSDCIKILSKDETECDQTTSTESVRKKQSDAIYHICLIKYAAGSIAVCPQVPGMQGGPPAAPWAPLRRNWDNLKPARETFRCTKSMGNTFAAPRGIMGSLCVPRGYPVKPHVGL